MPTKTQAEIILELVQQYPRPDVIEFDPEPEREPLFCPIISVDDHVLEPADLFVSRVSGALKDRVPSMVADEQGTPWWQLGDSMAPITVCDGSSGRPMSQWGLTPSRHDDFRPAVSDSKARLKDMDLSGVWASLGFASTVWGFAGTRLSLMKDQEAGLASVRAYNDWVHDEWCSADRNRFIPCQLTWLNEPRIAAEEIRRNADRGFRALSFSENPEALGLPHIYGEYWDPLLRACEETETVVNLHVGSSGTKQMPSSASPGDVGTVLFPVNGLIALVDWVYARIPIRFPGIKIALSEGGASWVPMVLERFNRAYRQARNPYQSWRPSDPHPAELVHRNFYFASIEDPSAFRMLDLIGEDKIMVETDYPHFDSTWPNCQAMIRSELDQLPTSVVKKVCYENAAGVYRHPCPPDSWINASVVGLRSEGTV